MSFSIRRKLPCIILALIFILPSLKTAVSLAADESLSRENSDITRNPQVEPLNGWSAISGVNSSAFISTGKSLFFHSASSIQLGTTWNDMQQNGSMGRQIVLGGGWIHNVWNYLPADTSANRNSTYYAYNPSTSTVISNPGVDPAVGGGGFCAIGYDVTGPGRPVVTYHKFADNRSKLARGDGLGLATFTGFPFSAAGVNCQSIVTGAGPTDGPYFWPKIAVDVDGTGQPIAHVVATEYAGAQLSISLVYYRTNPGMTGQSSICALWLDSVTTISAVVEQDPNSNKVAVVWLKPADWAHAEAIQQRNNDVVYQQSTNLGVSWQTQTNITNYYSANTERAYTDLSALYTSDGCLHVIWTTSYFDSASAIVGVQGARLYHWDNCSQCRSLLFDADNSEAECKRGFWNKNISKMSLSECIVGGSPRLYASYTYFTGDDQGNPAPRDCSEGGWANGEIFAQVSPNNGVTWGPPVNLTGTASDSCAAGSCNSEHWSSSAPYVSDSLRIQYILDRDPGSVISNEGTWTNNPVMNLSYPCFSTETYSHLSAIPVSINYPFHSVPGHQSDTTLIIVNSGNAAANYTRSVVYLSGSNWLSFPNDPPNSVVPVGCVFADTIKVNAMGPATEGLFQALVRFEYDTGDSMVTLQTEIDLYNFTEFFLPTDLSINTATNRLNVNQAGRIGNYDQGNLFSYTAAGVNYLRDGSLIVGTSASNLSWLIYQGAGGQPGVANNYGPLYAKSALTINSSHPQYHLATGLGVNRDSTIAYRVAYYAPKHTANSDFYLAKFCIYPGPHNTSGKIEDMTVAYAVDWEVPSDDGISNTGGGDDLRQMVYQRGASTPPNSSRYAALAVIREDGQPAPGGFVWENSRYVAPKRVYQVDSLWNKMNSITKFESTPVTGDLNSVVVACRHQTVNAPADSFEFVVVLAGQLNGSVTTLKTTVDKAKAFYCEYISVDQLGCPQYVCGDANGNSAVNISDAVYLINYIFAGGPAPNPVLAGDANCSLGVSISDVVYLINYIFAGGPAPCAACP